MISAAKSFAHPSISDSEARFLIVEAKSIAFSSQPDDGADEFPTFIMVELDAANRCASHPMSRRLLAEYRRDRFTLVQT